MLLKRLLAVALITFLAVPSASAKTRAVAARFEVPQDPAGWLLARAYILESTEFPAPSFDLLPLRGIVGDARIVGLGDGTHGTHEFYTMKLRLIDFLVRNMNFDVVAFEAPFPLFSRLDEYVQGGVGNPRALLTDGRTRLLYHFWDVEETLQVVEWLREYNAHRGDRPPVHISGFDVYDNDTAVERVLAFLRDTDSALASATATQYECVREKTYLLPGPQHQACRERSQLVVNALVEAHEKLEPFGYRYEEAVQNARVVLQLLSGNRDINMAANAQWLAAHRSRSGRIIAWAHDAHVVKTPTLFHGEPMGVHLDRALGDDYFVIRMFTSAGTLLQWDGPGTPDATPVVKTLATPRADSYEAAFALGPARALLIPLQGVLPPWLEGPATFRLAGTSGGEFVDRHSLPASCDAVVYIHETRATVPLPR
jgi:erythromycin esterase